MLRIIFIICNFILNFIFTFICIYQNLSPTLFPHPERLEGERRIMKATELRIGNLIYGVSDRIETVISITDGGKISTYKAKGNFVNDISDLTPIPLTPDILEKFGFENNNHWVKKFMHKDGYDLYIHELNGWIGVQLIYLHQLQNLYFALTE